MMMVMVEAGVHWRAQRRWRWRWGCRGRWRRHRHSTIPSSTPVQRNAQSTDANDMTDFHTTSRSISRAGRRSGQRCIEVWEGRQVVARIR